MNVHMQICYIHLFTSSFLLYKQVHLVNVNIISASTWQTAKLWHVPMRLKWSYLALTVKSKYSKYVYVTCFLQYLRINGCVSRCYISLSNWYYANIVLGKRPQWMSNNGINNIQLDRYYVLSPEGFSKTWYWLQLNSMNTLEPVQERKNNNTNNTLFRQQWFLHWTWSNFEFSHLVMV